jgi:hypothetical protein
MKSLRLPLFRSMAPAIGLTRGVFSISQDASFPFWRSQRILKGLFSHEFSKLGLQFATDLIRVPIPKTAAIRGIFYGSAFGEFFNDDCRNGSREFR